MSSAHFSYVTGSPLTSLTSRPWHYDGMLTLLFLTQLSPYLFPYRSLRNSICIVSVKCKTNVKKFRPHFVSESQLLAIIFILYNIKRLWIAIFSVFRSAVTSSVHPRIGVRYPQARSCNHRWGRVSSVASGGSLVTRNYGTC